MKKMGNKDYTTPSVEITTLVLNVLSISEYDNIGEDENWGDVF